MRGRTTTDALEASLQATWESIAEGRLDDLIKSMSARLQAVIDAGGGGDAILGHVE
jgi:hypothetical protein